MATAIQSKISSKIEKINAAKAAKYLENNIQNRPLSSRLVERYAHDIRKGHWSMTGEAIKFDTEGNLIDGQHRLHAIVAAQDHTVEMLVIRGLPVEAQKVMDSGLKRTMASQLAMVGYGNSTTLAAAARWCMQYEQDAMLSYSRGGHNFITQSDQLEWIDANPGVIEAVNWVKGLSRLRGKGVTHTMWAGLLYEAKGLEEEAKDFMMRYADRVMLAHGSPILALMNFVERNVEATKKPSPVVFSGVMVKAFNAHVKDEEVKILRFWPKTGAASTGRSQREDFPKILTSMDVYGTDE